MCLFQLEQRPAYTLWHRNVSLNALDWLARLFKCSKIIVNATCCHGYAYIKVFYFNLNALHLVNDLILCKADEIFVVFSTIYLIIFNFYIIHYLVIKFLKIFLLG